MNVYIYILIYYTEIVQYNLRDQSSEQVLDDCRELMFPGWPNPPLKWTPTF